MKNYFCSSNLPLAHLAGRPLGGVLLNWDVGDRCGVQVHGTVAACG